MSVEWAYGSYVPRKPTVKEAISAKMKVLEELCVVNNENRNEIRMELESQVSSQPSRDYELVLDQIAHKLIKQKFDD